MRNKRPDRRPERASPERERLVEQEDRGRLAARPGPKADARPPSTLPHHQNKSDEEASLKAFGTTDPDFYSGFFRQALRASQRGAEAYDSESLLFTLAVSRGEKPKDQLETMHLAQMAEVHSTTMRLFGEVARAQDLALQEVLLRAINQFVRTYTAQLEAFKRYRSGGDPRVTVQTVSVADGGQAIVGNVTQARAAPEKPANAAPALTDARQQAMEILGEPERVAVPLRPKSKT